MVWQKRYIDDEEETRFALAALQGMLAGNPCMDPHEAAKHALEYAHALDEALVKAREGRVLGLEVNRVMREMEEREPSGAEMFSGVGG